MKELIKRCKPIYAIIHKLHQQYINAKAKREYIHADDIRVVYNNRKSETKYLIFEYKGTQGLMAQMVGVLTWIKYAIENDYVVVVDMTDSSNLYQVEDENAWENFYYQPMLSRSATKSEIEYIKKHENYAICPLYDRSSWLWRKDAVKSAVVQKNPPSIIHPSTRDYKQNPSLQKEFQLLYRRYIRFKPNVEQYLLDEERTVLDGMISDRLLGVIVRGTDYTAQKPYMHPVQPSVEMILEKVNALAKKWDRIYLATDEKAIEDLFNQKYPGKVLTNQRYYYESSNYDMIPVRMIHHDRENDSFMGGIEYLSSMNILSKCGIILGGLCGGSQAALLMNGGRYHEVHLFDLGNYGVETDETN